MPSQPAQLDADVRRRKNEIDAAGCDGAAWHAVVFRSFGTLGECDASGGFDRHHTQRAVGRISGKNHADGPAPLFRRQ